MDPCAFLLTHCNVQCLPSHKNARVYLAGTNPLRRWQESALFPAFRRTAKVYRFLLRLKATIGLGSGICNLSNFWPVREFVEDVLPKVASVVVLVGTSGPTQKVTLQLWNDRQVVGYLKYGEKQTAQNRIKQEAEVLKALPHGLGPTLLKVEPFGEGLAVVLLPVFGEALGARLPLASNLISFVQNFPRSSPVVFEDHPWIKKMMSRYTDIPLSCITPLAGRKWPVVFQHGDFAPWNILVKPNGSLKAIDWEYGTAEGFPFIDLAFFILQVGRLIYRLSPKHATSHAIKLLSRTQSLNLTQEEAQAVVYLCAYDTCKRIASERNGSFAWWESCWNN